jgi:proteasome lid subunit RPN8/RPN11
MIKWSEQKSEIVRQPIERLYAWLAIPDVLRIESERGERILVIIAAAVRQTVRAHLRTRMTELGGLLIGEVFVDADAATPCVIRVLEAIPSHDYSSTGVSLRMESDVWSRARAALGGDRLIVGWYHSHPGLSAFFSDTDRKTQRAFFAHAYSLGWVVDPTDDDEKIYLGAESAEIAPACLLGSL